jgi:broad specificity phosphatase PhoE
MKLILIRHAITQETGKRLSGRLPGIPLSPSGVAAAQEVATNLASLDVSAVYTSPIERCRQTAGILANPHGRKPRVRQQIIEVEYGAWSGRTLRSLYRLRSWKGLMRDPAEFRVPEGETLEEVRIRCVRFLASMRKTYRDETVLAVSHGDVIRTIVAHCLNGSVDAIHRLHVSPLGITVIQLSADHPPTVSIVNAPRL